MLSDLSRTTIHAVVSRRRDTRWWLCRPFVVVSAQLFAALQVAEDAREACHRENAVGQKMAQQGDCPKGCGIVALLLETSGTRADVSGRGGLFATDDRVFKECSGMKPNRRACLLCPPRSSSLKPFARTPVHVAHRQTHIHSSPSEGVGCASACPRRKSRSSCGSEARIRSNSSQCSA